MRSPVEIISRYSKKLLFPFFVLSSLHLNAQNYLINFAGNGAVTTVTTAKVENLD